MRICSIFQISKTLD